LNCTTIPREIPKVIAAPRHAKYGVILLKFKDERVVIIAKTSGVPNRAKNHTRSNSIIIMSKFTKIGQTNITLPR